MLALSICKQWLGDRRDKTEYRIAAEPIECPEHYRVELALVRVHEQQLKLLAVSFRAGFMINILADHRPTLLGTKITQLREDK